MTEPTHVPAQVATAEGGMRSDGALGARTVERALPLASCTVPSRDEVRMSGARSDRLLRRPQALDRASKMALVNGQASVLAPTGPFSLAGDGADRKRGRR